MDADQLVKQAAGPTRGTQGKSRSLSEKRGGAWFQWVEFTAFVVLSAAIYALAFESSLYRTILTGDGLHPGLFADAVIFWVIWAKTVVLFVPLVAVVTLVILLKRMKTAQVLGFFGWAIIFSYLTLDLILVTFNGTHLADWLPYLYDILEAPESNQAQYAGNGIGLAALQVAMALLAAGWALIMFSRWAAAKVHSRFRWLDSCRGAVTVGLCISALAAGSVPALSSLNSPTLVRRLDLALPLNDGFFEDLALDSSQVIARVQGGFQEASSAMPSRLETSSGVSSLISQTTVLFENRTLKNVDLADYCLLGKRGVTLPLGGKLPRGGQAAVTLRTEQIPLGEFFLVNRDGRLTYRLKREPQLEGIKLVLSREGQLHDSLGAGVHRALATVKERYLEDALNPKPADPEAVVRKAPLPNVILIVLESLRYTAVTPDLTKRLYAWSSRGLRLERHYSASNCSHLSLFSLLYGRNGLGYGATLDSRVPPQMCESLGRSGYECSFLTSHECRHFQRMHEYLNESFFPRIEWLGGGSWEDFRAWPDADRRVLAEVRKIGSTESGKPQFIFAFLLSTHYPYVCDKKFEMHKPCGMEVRIENVMLNRDLTHEMLINRYRNSMLFLEDELMRLIDSLDPERNIIIVTGDHGESIGEDGVLSHNSRASEIQTRVPFAMVGAGVKPLRIAMATSHMDVLPTLLHALAGQTVPIRNCHGRDLLDNDVEDSGIAITPLMGREVVIVRGEERFLFKASLKPSGPSSVAFHGLIDEKGLPKALGSPPRPGWFY